MKPKTSRFGTYRNNNERFSLLSPVMYKVQETRTHHETECSVFTISDFTLSVCLQIFRGNSNTYTVELRAVSPPIIARRLRFVPFSRHPRTVCMRVEAYGCDRAGASPLSLILVDCGFLLCVLAVLYSAKAGEIVAC